VAEKLFRNRQMKTKKCNFSVFSVEIFILRVYFITCIVLYYLKKGKK